MLSVRTHQTDKREVETALATDTTATFISLSGACSEAISEYSITLGRYTSCHSSQWTSTQHNMCHTDCTPLGDKNKAAVWPPELG